MSALAIAAEIKGALDRAKARAGRRRLLERLIVEFDGYKFHGRRAAFEADRRRDQRLVAAGHRVIRITWRQLEREPYAVIARLAQALIA